MMEPKSTSRRLHRQWHQLHRTLGTALGALFLLIAISGALTASNESLRAWEYDVHDATASSEETPETYVRDIRTLMRANPDWADDKVYIGYPASTHMPVLLNQPDGHERRFVVERSTGAIIEEKESEFTDWITELHHHLQLPGNWGFLILGLSGVYFCLLTLSGIFLHLKSRLPAPRPGRPMSAASKATHIHRRYGIVIGVVLFVVAATGASLGLTVLDLRLAGVAAFDGDLAAAVREFSPDDPTEDTPMPTDDHRVSALIEMLDVVDGGPPRYVRVVDYGQPVETLQLVAETSDLFAFITTHTVQTSTGATLRVRDPRTSTARLSAGVVVALHFGTVFGLAGELLYALFGWVAAWVVAFGLTIGITRRRRGSDTSAALRLQRGSVWAGLLALPLVSVLGFALTSYGGGAPFNTLLLSTIGAFWIAGGVLSSAQLRKVSLGIAVLSVTALLAGALSGRSVDLPSGVLLTLHGLCFAAHFAICDLIARWMMEAEDA